MRTERSTTGTVRSAALENSSPAEPRAAAHRLLHHVAEIVALGAVAVALRAAVAVALPGSGEHNRSRLAAVMAVAVTVVGAATAQRLEAATDIN